MRAVPKPESMTDDDTTDDTTDAQIEEELNAVLAGKNPLANLRVTQTGPCHYTVLSARNGGATAHRVNLQDVTCTCEDMTYNKNLGENDDGGREVCAHLAAAMLAHPQLETEGMALYKTLGLMDRTDRVLQKILSERNLLQNVAETAADAKNTAEQAASRGSADAPETTPSEAAGQGDDGGDPEPDAGAQDAADRLQEAFDDVIDDMEVEAAAGHVWFKTGYDTPESWPFPGGDETFSVITSPDMTKYVHDGSPDWADSPHPLDDSRPGEYWKNALEPEDVDDYISEVLE